VVHPSELTASTVEAHEPAPDGLDERPAPEDLTPLLDEHGLTEAGEALMYQYVAECGTNDDDTYIGAYKSVEREQERRDAEELRRERLLAARPRFLPVLVVRPVTGFVRLVTPRARECRPRRTRTSSGQSPGSRLDDPDLPLTHSGERGR